MFVEYMMCDEFTAAERRNVYRKCIPFQIIISLVGPSGHLSGRASLTGRTGQHVYTYHPYGTITPLQGMFRYYMTLISLISIFGL